MGGTEADFIADDVESSADVPESIALPPEDTDDPTRLAANSGLAKWLIGALLLSAFFGVVRFAYGTLPIGELRSIPGLMTASSVVMLVSVPLGVAVLFAFWALARGRTGANLLLLAAVFATLAPTLGTAPALFIRWLSERAMDVFISAQSYVFYLVLVLGFAAQLLFAAGLIRTRLVPRWVGWAGVAVAAYGATATVLARVSHGSLRWVVVAGTLVGAGFYVLLGTVLARESLQHRRQTPSFILVGAVFGLVAILTLALAATVGVRANAVEAAQTPISLQGPFSRLFPGFTNDGELPVLMASDAKDMVEEFDIKRSGRAVLQVEFSADRRLVDTTGPMHPKPIPFSVPVLGTMWVGDSYFANSPDSVFASIPRAKKLALWDAFSAPLTQKVRILGVFPIEQLRDRSLLATDGYSPKDLDGSTIVVYTPEFESAVNEEVPWATADELIANARQYENENRANDGTNNDRLDVRAFSWVGSQWHPVPRRAAP